LVSLTLLYYTYGAQPPRPSFPTRRSSDLTDCTRPADSEGLILRHSTGESSKPTRRSRMRRVSWASTRWESISRVLSRAPRIASLDRKSTRLNSSHVSISYAVCCLKKKRDD